MLRTLFVCAIVCLCFSAGAQSKNNLWLGKRNAPVLDIDVRGGIVAAISAHEAAIWDLRSMSLLHSSQVNDQKLNAVGLGQDSLTLITGSAGGQVTLMNMVTKEQIVLMPAGDQGAVTSLDVNVDANLVAAGFANKRVAVFSLADGSLKFSYTGHSTDVTAVQFRASGNLLTASGDGEVIEHTTGFAKSERLANTETWITSISISDNDTQYIVGDSKGTLVYLPLDRGNNEGYKRKVKPGWVTSVDFMQTEPPVYVYATLGGKIAVITSFGTMKYSVSTIINRIKFIPSGAKIRLAVATNKGLQIVEGITMTTGR
jgi:WD40 repeat protein